MNQNPELFCPNCKQLFSPDQIDLFFKGEYVVCEVCGLGFRRSIENIQVQQIKKNDGNSITKIKENQTLKTKFERWKRKTSKKIKNYVSLKIEELEQINSAKDPQKNKKYNSKGPESESNDKNENTPHIPQNLKTKISKPYIHPQARYDPFTGQPLFPEELKDKSKKFSINLTEEILSRIFQVLDGEVREKLLSLEIPKDEKNLIAKSFIYLTKSQQLIYLEEVRLVNPDSQKKHKDLEKTKELISIIRTIPIPIRQQEYLIEQLNYIPDEEKHDFVKYIKESSQ